MQIKSETAPTGAFIIEPDPTDPSRVLVHLYENAEHITPAPYWQYDDYTVSVPRRSDLESDIEKNYSHWMDKAKSSEDT